MKTLIFGGTFNPPHLGHERMVELAEAALHPDRFLIIPTCLPPHKELAAGSPAPEERLALCKAAFGNCPYVTVSDLELRRGAVSYTADTLAELRALFPDDEFYLLLGSDSFLIFPRWHRFEEILRTCTLLVVSREEGERERLLRAAEDYRTGYGANSVLLPADPFVLSSSEIRGGDFSEQTLSKPVLDYILEHHLYGK